MLVSCCECGNRASDTAASCPGCGAPSDIFLGKHVSCAECGEGVHVAFAACPNCGAPRDVYLGAALPTRHAKLSATGQEHPKQPAEELAGARITKTSSALSRLGVIISIIFYSFAALAGLVIFVESFNSYARLIWSDTDHFSLAVGASMSVAPGIACALLIATIRFAVRGRFRPVPGTSIGVWVLIGSLLMAGPVVGLLAQLLADDWGYAGSLVGAVLAVGLLSRIAWVVGAFIPGPVGPPLAVHLLSAIAAWSLAWIGFASEISDATSTGNFLAPYGLGSLFWIGFDLALPRLWKPQRYLKRIRMPRTIVA